MCFDKNQTLTMMIVIVVFIVIFVGGLATWRVLVQTMETREETGSEKDADHLNAYFCVLICVYFFVFVRTP